MTGAHVETIQTLFPQSAEKTFLLREFEEPGTTVWRDVPDPIGLGREVYEDCARIIKNALPSVLAFVEQGELVRPGAMRAADISSYSMDHLSRQFEPGRPPRHRRPVTARHCAKSIRKFSMRLPRKKNANVKTSN